MSSSDTPSSLSRKSESIYDRPTPRTDAAAILRDPPVPFQGQFVRVEFARQLEQELETVRDAHMANCLAADTLRTEIRELRESASSERATLSPNVDGRNFYELCQQYRHAKEMMPPGCPNVVQAFDNLREYIKTGKLPWESFE